MLENKIGMIFGVANKRSIAWACAKAAGDHGARMAFTYQGERIKENVSELAATLNDSLVVPCDVTNQSEVDAAFAAVQEKYGRLDFLVHSIAFAPREALEGEFVTTTREAFQTALEVSAFSLTQVSLAAAPLMTEGGSIVTLTYLGAARVFPNYNVMGVAKAALECSVRYLASDLGPRNIRVNAISAGPVKTLAAKGISGFSDILGVYRERAPLRRNTESSEVGDTGLFLISDAARGITGEVLYVDGGYHVMGM
jgi:enoyl-[acyl-carrier protein] reductase I